MGSRCGNTVSGCTRTSTARLHRSRRHSPPSHHTPGWGPGRQRSGTGTWNSRSSPGGLERMTFCLYSQTTPPDPTPHQTSLPQQGSLPCVQSGCLHPGKGMDFRSCSICSLSWVPTPRRRKRQAPLWSHLPSPPALTSGLITAVPAVTLPITVPGLRHALVSTGTGPLPRATAKLLRVAVLRRQQATWSTPPAFRAQKGPQRTRKPGLQDSPEVSSATRPEPEKSGDMDYKKLLLQLEFRQGTVGDTNVGGKVEGDLSFCKLSIQEVLISFKKHKQKMSALETLL